MKNLLLLFAAALLFASCNSYNRAIAIPENEKYTAIPITPEQGNTYKRNYENDNPFKRNFRRGMMIPMTVIDAIRAQAGVDGISISYGKHPDYASPVFIVTGSRGVLKYTREGVEMVQEEVVYMVYYPCPTMCS